MKGNGDLRGKGEKQIGELGKILGGKGLRGERGGKDLNRERGEKILGRKREKILGGKKGLTKERV